MKRLVCALIVCVLLMSVVVPLTAFATEEDDFVPSVEQGGDVDDKPSPKTGDTILYVPLALAGISAAGAVVLCATAEKKHKEES